MHSCVPNGTAVYMQYRMNKILRVIRGNNTAVRVSYTAGSQTSNQFQSQAKGRDFLADETILKKVVCGEIGITGWLIRHPTILHRNSEAEL